MANNPSNTQVVEINDFSPGIYQYGVGSYPISYSTSSPLGSASFAARCINQPKIGLVPFYNYTTGPSVAVPVGNSPGSNPWSRWTNVGIGAIGGVGNQNQSLFASLSYPYTDVVVIAACGVDSAGTFYHYGFSFYSTDGTIQFNTQSPLWASQVSGVGNNPCGVSFDLTSQFTATSGVGVYPMPILIMGSEAFTTTYLISSILYIPAWTTIFGEFGSITGSVNGWAAFAHSGRVFLINAGFHNVFNSATEVVQTDDIFYYSDPPAEYSTTATGVAPPFATLPNMFSLEDASGFGAWGSVSTGELVLIRRGHGAVVVTGDAGSPSFALKLPAVQGTGQIAQRMTMCQAGAVYVSQSGGVWAWNGGNTSAEISQQIPDTGVIRSDLEYGGFAGNRGFIGVRTWHDELNGIVFFPNNYVYDSVNNSWWMCEDPGVVKFGAFASGKSTARFMYGTTISPIAGRYYVYIFDTLTLASSYTWISNPIPSVAGTLSTITQAELVASNPTTTPCTVTITPTIPTGNMSSFKNNPQSANFTIPPSTSGYRAKIPLGFTEYNICISVQAANSNNSNPAPVIHAINLTFSNDQTAGIRG